MNEVVKILKLALYERSREIIGKMILCTVAGDIHNIGKDIVKLLLKTSGIEILDLGVEVPAEAIIHKAKEESIRVIGLSGVLTLSIDLMKQTVEAFGEAGMRNDVKIIIGGSPVNEGVFNEIKSDAWTINPYKGVRICRKWFRQINRGNRGE